MRRCGTGSEVLCGESGGMPVGCWLTVVGAVWTFSGVASRVFLRAVSADFEGQLWSRLAVL